MEIIKSLQQHLDQLIAMAQNEEESMLEKTADGKFKVYRRASLVDPNMIVSYGGASYGAYRPRYSHISFKTLKEMSLRDNVIAAIMQTRVNQISAFSRPQANRYDTGFKIVANNPEMVIQPGSKEEQEIKFLTDFIRRTGYDDQTRHSKERMDFDTWLRLVTRDRLTYGSAAVEKIMTEFDTLHSFLPVPTETIYYANKTISDQVIDNIKLGNKEALLSDTVASKEEIERFDAMKRSLKQGEYEFVQVIEGRIVEGFTNQELIYKLGNPQNFIDNNGYPIGELEMATNVITAHLQAENYTKLFFCVSPDSLIRTRSGQEKIVDLYSKFNGKTIDIWTGTQFHKGQVYKTQELEECETHLKSGQILKTSGEHWFYILREGDTEPRFVNQKNLQVGDFVLVSKLTDGYKARDYRNEDRNDLITLSLSQAIANALIDKIPVCAGEQRNGIRTRLFKIMRGESRFSRQNARSLCADHGLNQFMDTLSFYQVPIVATKNTGNVVQMYDIEILDPIHRFTLDGVVVHNTHGFAARGLLHIRGDITPAQLQAFRAQWMAQIAGNTNSWRTPILAGAEDVQWVQLSATNRDMEYSNYIDQIIRTLCALFQISPLECGFDYLTRGSEQKSMSESSNEWKIKEAQDRGLRPLLIWLENLINEDILPLIKPELNGKYHFCFVGLDAESKEEELNRQAAESKLHTSLNDIRQEIGKPPVMGGDIPLNPDYLNFLLRTHKISEIRNIMLGYEDDNVEEFDYIPDPLYFNNKQMLMEPAPMVDEMGNPIEQPVDEMGNPVEGAPVDEEGIPAEEQQVEEGNDPVEVAVAEYFDKHPEMLKSEMKKAIEKDIKANVDPKQINLRYDKIRQGFLDGYKDIEKDMVKEILEAVKEEIDPKDEKK